MIASKVLVNFKNKHCLVTGGTGLIGRQVVEILVGAGAKVTTVSLDRITVGKIPKHILGDLTNLEFCRQVTKGVDFVFHLAGIKGSIEVTKNKPASFFVPLLMMNTNVLEACRLNNVKKIVYTSSIGAYSPAETFKENQESSGFGGEPMDSFPGWAKRMAELQIRAYRIQYGLSNFAIVRPCNVYGPGDNFDPKSAMVIPSLIYKIYKRENPVIVWGDGTAIRDFLFSKDAAEGIILALYYGTGGSFVNLGSGKGYSIRELVETLAKVVDFEWKFDRSKPSGFGRRVMDVNRAKRLIYWQPSTTLVDGLKQTWEWFVKHHSEFKLKKNYFKN